MSYWRIHDTSRCTPEQLLEECYQVSRVWVGAMYRQCEHCDGTGTEAPTSYDSARMGCEHCDGEGQIAIEEQAGVSCCESLADLRAYLAERECYTEGCVVVELDGETTSEDDMDAAEGAVLVRPSRIVAVHPVSVLD